MAYKLNLLETRVHQLQQQIERQEGMLKRTYAFMKQCERSGMVPEGWTIDSGAGGVTFRPMGGNSGAAKPDELLLRQARAYALPSPSSPRSSNNNNRPALAEDDGLEEERRELKRLKTELSCEFVGKNLSGENADK